MIEGIGNQLRIAGMGGVFGLDFGAVLALGAALGAPADLLADVLPAVEAVLVRRAHGETGDVD